MLSSRGLYLLLGLLITITYNACGGFSALQENGSLTSASICRNISPNYPQKRVWRLTREQLQSSINSILKTDLDISSEFNAGIEALGYFNNAELNNVNESFVQNLNRLSDVISSEALKKKNELLNCGNTPNDSCIINFIASYGKRFFRRPLTEEEKQSFFKTYNDVQGQTNSDFGFQALIQSFVMSPNFIYRYEVGGAQEGKLSKMTKWEVASLIAFTLTNSTPTDWLLDSKQVNKLDTAEGIKSIINEMWGSPSSRKGLQQFVKEYLHISSLDELSKSEVLYPGFSQEVRQKLTDETLKFFENLAFDNPSSSIKDLFTADYTFADDTLLKHYGAPARGFNTLQKVSLGIKNHSGILSQGALMSFLANPEESNPIKRGKFVRERLFCQTLAPPPDGEIPELPEIQAGTPNRERYKIHATDPQCARCHDLIDPIGFGFEQYDAIGRFQNQQHGVPVDASGHLIIESGLNEETFSDLQGLGQILGESPIVSDCLVTQYFRYSQGRSDSEGDQCSLEQVKNKINFSTSFKELVMKLLTSEIYLYRE